MQVPCPSCIFPEIGKRTVHIGHGMLQFASGKMSSRKGNVITGEALIKQVEDLVGEKIKGREFEDSEIENALKKWHPCSHDKYYQ